MQILIIAIGKIKEKFVREGIAEYEKRLRPYVTLQIRELAEEKRPVSASISAEKAALEKEGERILAAIPAGSFVISLDIIGTGWSSVELAEFVRHRELSGMNQIAFVIGGDLGLSSRVPVRERYATFALEDDLHPPNCPAPAP